MATIREGHSPVLLVVDVQVGVLSDAFASNGDVSGLRLSMTLVALINIFTGLFFWTLSRRIGKVYPALPAAV